MTRLKVLTFSTLFPSSVRPGHGIFVETRLRELLKSGEVESRTLLVDGQRVNDAIYDQAYIGTDGIIDLVEKGIVNNRYKTIHPNRTVTSFALGSRRLYDFVDDNPSFAFLDVDYVNEATVIRRNARVIAINSAIEVDLTGQICADSIGTYHYSGVGGQMDFMRGAALSDGGKPIIAVTSRTAKGIPRIVPLLKPGAGVVTTRAHVHYVVTEYGVAYLFGKNLRQRAKALIDIAHPDDREMLERACVERFHQFSDL